MQRSVFNRLNKHRPPPNNSYHDQQCCMHDHRDRESGVDSLSALCVFRVVRKEFAKKAPRIASEISYRGPGLFSQARD
jgi:hypothetical protein